MKIDLQQEDKSYLQATTSRKKLETGMSSRYPSTLKGSAGESKARELPLKPNIDNLQNIA